MIRPLRIAIADDEAEIRDHYSKVIVRLGHEVVAAVGYWKGNFYVLEYKMMKGHTPNWTIATFFEMAQKWKPRKIRIESTAYQRTLAWLIKEAMRARTQYYVIEEVDDKRGKGVRIIDSLQGPASEGALFFQNNQSDLIEQFVNYPNCQFDDIIDAVAMAVTGVKELMTWEAGAEDNEAGIPELEWRRKAP